MTATMIALLYVLSGNRYDIYLSHPMTTGNNSTLEENIANMHIIAYTLRAQGYTVFNPADIHEHGWTQAQYMTFYLHYILPMCNKVVFCKGYYMSKGCMAEYDYAVQHGIDIQCIY